MFSTDCERQPSSVAQIQQNPTEMHLLYCPLFLGEGVNSNSIIVVFLGDCAQVCASKSLHSDQQEPTTGSSHGEEKGPPGRATESGVPLAGCHGDTALSRLTTSPFPACCWEISRAGSFIAAHSETLTARSSSAGT